VGITEEEEIVVMSALMATCRLAFHAFKGKPAIDCDTVKNI
jgi:hypothetical protein